jgi:hypothetical protein
VDSHTRKAESIERIQIGEEIADEMTYDSDDGRPDPLNGFMS